MVILYVLSLLLTVVLFFFFKQKTAYEMRISDWSSDVCSSDLSRASMDAGFRSYWRTSGHDPSRIVMDSPPDREDVRPWLRIRELLEDGGVRVPRVQIGRASCRERVCQYVSLSVVAVCLKKKRNSLPEAHTHIHQQPKNK